MNDEEEEEEAAEYIVVLRVIQTWDGTCCHAMNVSMRKLA
jgi:hypothetical protein